MVTVGMDPHKHVHVAVAVDAACKRIGNPLTVQKRRIPDHHEPNRPGQVRTVSTCTPVSTAILALDLPRAAKSTIRARSRARCSLLCPEAAFFSRCRSVAVRTIGRAEVTGKAGRPIGRSGCLGSSEGFMCAWAKGRCRTKCLADIHGGRSSILGT